MITVTVLIDPIIVSSSQTTQYTSTDVTTLIDKMTATNFSGSPATISVNLVKVGDTAGTKNLITDTKTLAAGTTYTFPEIVGHALNSGDFISIIAGTANAINMRASGRQIT